MKKAKKAAPIKECRCGECKILRAMFGPEYKTEHDSKQEE